MPDARSGAVRLLMPMIDGHRGPHGPYTVGSALLHHLVPPALERSPGEVAAHDIEIRAVAPGLRDRVAVRRVTVDADLPDEERILVPAPRRTLRLANGVTEFVRAVVPAGRTLVVCNGAEADPTDTELLEVMARRIPPRLLTIVVQPDGPRPPDDTRDAGTLWELVDRCVREGFLHAVVELGRRGLTRTEPGGPPWWRFAQRTATALGGLGRVHEAREVWGRVRRASQDPAMHAAAAYGMAMLEARHPDPARRDLAAARGWINEAIAISGLLPDPVERAFKLGFDRNGLALIELREGRRAAALALVESALELARELGERHPVHRMVLLANRARLLAGFGRDKEALDDYAAAIAIDPMFPDHHLDRGNLLVRLGRHDEALEDYECAMRAGPPLPEAHYNRAELRITRGDLDGALADLDRVIDLDPSYLDARVNRAGLLAGLDRDEEARAEVTAGLALAPGDPHLLVVLGQLETAAGRLEEARRALDRAVEAAPSLASAWGSRGVLRFAEGDPEGALEDLSQAIGLEPMPDLYANRAVALRALGRTAEADADEERASRRP
ncbi:tetratricopeptide repeat protein [Nonomuraea cavernae]|uniref:tetratricopeptide repeat protein n=1 Tax=Nonomuraea cavernae TaxID=2045107 RepID=UPI001CD93452|nr:tetratricopeptide repeat protein [Nonomuraea cavernae]MCA2190210.1 tetratricopeptide repeat protein [Nonomuraea cavernae]